MVYDGLSRSPLSFTRREMEMGHLGPELVLIDWPKALAKWASLFIYPIFVAFASSVLGISPAC